MSALSQDTSIHLLPAHLINRIAAGEVVERPASVVKELLENALDAGASKIDISIGDGGRAIRVADNGKGMSPEDAKLAFYNHATSKINQIEDLDCLQTLGFRGEALASISAVSRMVCLTRRVDISSETGTRVLFNEEHEPITEPAGCAPGTIMEVNDLFFNTPARLKFLKRPQTEMAHIQELVEAIAISHPDVQLILTLNGKPVLKTSGSGNRLQAVEEVFQFSKEGIVLYPVAFDDPISNRRIEGVISAPDVTKSSKRWMIHYVNQRLVKCATFQKAVEAGFESLMPYGRYPVSILLLSIPGDAVDVNVHPTKREVRYAKPNEVFSFVRHGVVQTLTEQGQDLYARQPSPAASPQSSSSPSFMSPPVLSYSQSAQGQKNRMPLFSVDTASTMALQKPLTALNSSGSHSKTPLDMPISSSEYNPQPVRVIGQLFNTYILVETPQGLLVVDQHIASERVWFERFSEQLNQPPETIQKKLFSDPIGISASQAALLEESRDIFSRLGFTYSLTEQTGSPALLSLLSVPVLVLNEAGVDRGNPEDLFISLLGQPQETGLMKLNLDHLIATLACHRAVRAGDVLKHEQMTLVIQNWLKCTLPWTCPHGRPIAHTIDSGEIQRFFDRQSLPVNA
ncbi:MAG: DNA mismatch repair endonuclease MutL [Cyanobacteria bacterium]|nr:DNA mismatch repair endonuclease MutL [Cyanobacteriota bacterium]